MRKAIFNPISSRKTAILAAYLIIEILKEALTRVMPMGHHSAVQDTLQKW
jgi:hypothetical protein